MPLIRKKIIEPQTYTTRDGEIQATDGRIKSWVDKANRMAKKGIKLSVPWGHNGKALPIDPSDPKATEFAGSRFNAGFVEGWELDSDGGAICLLDIPGVQEKNGKLVSTATLPDGNVVTTAIKDVSPAFTRKYTDGTNETWEDIICHVALTPEPVWANQPAFELAMSNLKDPAEPLFYLSSPKLEAEKKVGDKLMKPAPAADDEVPDDESTPLDPNPEPNDDEERCKRLMGLLASCGCPLPPDTTCDNVLERLEVALGVLQGKMQADKAAEADKKKKEQNQNNNGDNVTEAPSPGIMMSNPIMANPVTRKVIIDEAKRRKDRCLERIETMKLRGLPVAVANKMAAAVGTIQMSLSKSGELNRMDIESQLDILDETLPDKMDLLSTAKVLVSPVEEPKEKMVKHEASGLMMTETQHADVMRHAHS